MSKREDIIAAAVEEFGEYGYDLASVNRIIRLSGTSKGTFYHYFADKKALYFTVFQESVKIKQAYFVRMAEQTGDEGRDFFGMLKIQTKAGLLFMRENPALYKFGSRFASERSPVKEEVSGKVMPEVGAAFRKVIQAGIDGGRFSDRYPADFTARIISYLVMNYYDMLFGQDEPPTLEALEERLDMLFDFMKRGLC